MNNAIHCCEYGKTLTLSQDNTTFPICVQCLPKYETDIQTIRNYLSQHPKSTKTDIAQATGMPISAISMYIEEGFLFYPHKKLISSTDKTVASSCQGVKIKDIKITNAHILKENEFEPFILLGGSYEIKVAHPIKFKELIAGDKERQLKGTFPDDVSPELKSLLHDGNKFTVYFEHNDLIVPSDCLFFSGRPLQINLQPNKMHLKKQRAKRFKTNKICTLTHDGKNVPIALNDISSSGVSFQSADIILNKGDKAFIGEREICIVERVSLRVKYFYRAYFIDTASPTAV